jgi:hypothetical protein
LEDKHPGDRQVLLLQDSLKAQRTGEYVRFLQSRGVESAYGPRNQTEYWQPIDAGHIGAVLKQLGRAELEKWMETPSNPDAPPESRQYHWQLWESNKMQASEKRIFDDLGVWSSMGAALDAEVCATSENIIRVD